MELNPTNPELKPPVAERGVGQTLGYRRPVVVRDIPDLNRLSGRPDPTLKQEIKWEQPWHRAAAYHIASGMSMKDTAVAVECSYQTVKNLVKQPWFQANVSALMAENGGKDIMDLFRGEAINSFLTLVELRDDIKVAPSVRHRSAIDIIQQVIGKAPVKVEMSGHLQSSDPVAEAARLEESIQRLSLQGSN